MDVLFVGFVVVVSGGCGCGRTTTLRLFFFLLGP